MRSPDRFPPGRALLALALAALALTGAARADEDPAAIEAYHRQTEEIRGLRFLRPVKVEMRGRDELREYMRASFEREVDPEEIALGEAVLKQLDLMPPGGDLEAIFLEMMEENVAGFYDPTNETLWIIRDGQASGRDPTVIVHELIHALEDQHFDLEALSGRVEGHDDRALALQGLVEGSATYGMLQPMMRGNVEDPRARRIALAGVSFVLEASGAAQPSDAPDFVMGVLVYPYAHGLGFVSDLIEDRGFAALDQLYADPPSSTEQILHPEKYFAAERDEPVERRLPDLAPALGDGWERLGDNTLGELQLRLAMREWLVMRPTQELRRELPEELEGLGRLLVHLGSRLVPPFDPVRIAAGWDGDRYQVLHHASGRTAMVWWTCWDSAEEAAEFERAYAQAAGFRGRQPGRVGIVRTGAEVVILEDVPPAARSRVLERLEPAAF